MSAKTGLSRVRPTEEKEGRALRLPPVHESVAPPAAARAPLAPAPAPERGEVRPAKEAWYQICEPLRRRKGIRVIFLGVSGKGKTHGIADLIDYIVDAQLVDLVLIHDVKLAEIQYKGAVIHEADRVCLEPPESYPAVRVLRKNGLDHMPSVEGAARVTLESGFIDVPTVFVLDEFDRALNENGSYEARSVKRLFSEGLGMRASIIAAKQLPQFTPTTAMAQSDLVVFGENGKGASYLVDEDYIPRVAGDVVGNLVERQFILVPGEGNWNGQIYEVPER